MPQDELYVLSIVLFAEKYKFKQYAAFIAAEKVDVFGTEVGNLLVKILQIGCKNNAEKKLG